MSSPSTVRNWSRINRATDDFGRVWEILQQDELFPHKDSRWTRQKLLPPHWIVPSTQWGLFSYWTGGFSEFLNISSSYLANQWTKFSSTAESIIRTKHRERNRPEFRKEKWNYQKRKMWKVNHNAMSFVGVLSSFISSTSWSQNL